MESLEIYRTYQDYKQELDGELKKTAEGFVRIGYLLKVARDTNILAESGYKSVTEFAQKEYGLDKTQVSRFISINDRFAKGGERLLPEYEEYGYAKLTIMLQIPEEITQELTPEYTKAEIQAVKEELDEEKKTSDLEIFLEKPEEEEDESLMKKTLKELGKSDPDLWEKLWKESKKDGWLDQSAMDLIMAPSGDKNYSVRIMGMGRVMLTMKDGEDRVSITNTRTLEKEIYTKADMRGIWSEILIDAESAGEAYRKTFAEPWPKVEVAPVQQEKKPEPKKESKVSKAKTPEKPKKPSTEHAPAAVVEEPQLPGQMKVEDFPEMMPPEEEKNNGETDQLGMPDGAGNEANDGESCGVDEKEAGEEPDALQDHGADGAEQSEGSEGDIERGNREMFELIKKTSDCTSELSLLTGVKFWAYNLETLRKAYKLAVDAAAGMEELARREGWSLYEG